MAPAPLIQLSDVTLEYGDKLLFDNINLVIAEGNRFALVGRNGTGKSTLMKVIAGLITPDDGKITSPAGTSIGYLDQDPDMEGFSTLEEFAQSGVADGARYKL
ncbi:MAG: ABC-F family ATP-binding cassette domain-containing protein, partial [Rhodobacteraceae bacterium]|nr:ABC-F family ATP-binding cassette domain-containing protein [Paracoccaceae bacterium]